MGTFDGHGYLEFVTRGYRHVINLRLFWWVDGDVAVYLHPLRSLFSLTFFCHICFYTGQNIDKGQDFLRKSIVNEHLSFSRNLDFYLYLNFQLHAF